VPLFPVILAAFAFCLFMLIRDPSFDNRILGWNRFNQLKPVLIRFLIYAVVLGLFVWFYLPEKFLILPREKPGLMLMIFLFYPIFSVYPQEVIFRAYFFHRLGGLFPNMPVAVVVNAILFALGHLVFHNGIILAATFLGSFLFARTYWFSKSTLGVFLEHALYGNFIYLIGVGEWFVKIN
jgi:membrane protease YdiL (CAAX protease family)